MKFKEFINECDEVAVSYEVDRYLSDLGFEFNFNKYCKKECYKILKCHGELFKLGIFPFGIILYRKDDDTKYVSILSLLEKIMNNNMIIDKTYIKKIDTTKVTKELLNSTEVINLLNYAMKNFDKLSKDN